MIFLIPSWEIYPAEDIAAPISDQQDGKRTGRHQDRRYQWRQTAADGEGQSDNIIEDRHGKAGEDNAAAGPAEPDESRKITKLVRTEYGVTGWGKIAAV